jgi:hypothetical protein
MDDDSLVKSYLEQLETAKNPAVVLVSFYSRLFELDFDKNLIPGFAKLTKLYGPYTVLYAIASAFTFVNGKPDNIYGLLTRICSMKLEESIKKNNNVDLSDMVKNCKAEAEKLSKKKLEASNPFD